MENKLFYKIFTITTGLTLLILAIIQNINAAKINNNVYVPKEYNNIIILKKGDSYELNNKINWILIKDSVGSIRRVPCYDQMIYDWLNEGDSIKNIKF